MPKVIAGGLCSHCKTYMARPRTGKCLVCSASPMTKKQIKAAREKLGIEEVVEHKPKKKAKAKRAKAEKGGTQTSLFATPVVTSKGPSEAEIEIVKKAINTAYIDGGGDNRLGLETLHEKYRSTTGMSEDRFDEIIGELLDDEYILEPSLGVLSIADPPPLPKKKRKTAKNPSKAAGKSRPRTKYRSEISNEMVSAYFAVLADRYGKKDWMEQKHYIEVARGRLEEMKRSGEAWARVIEEDRLDEYSLEEAESRMEEYSTLVSIGLL